MADYIYLLEHRLSAAQRASITLLRALATGKGLTLFLVGGAVRDLTSGSPVRDLDFVVQGNALGMRRELEEAGAEITGEQPSLQSLYIRMPGGVRAELGSTLSATWPKPGKPVFAPAPLGEDLRRRDFTANAMALSLNEGSYGLLIDPLNGVADIENRQLRLVSNYGFIEEPVRMIRATRLMARLGWTLEDKTQGRYETAQEEGYVSALSEFQRGYELEEVVHEEDPLRVLKRLESEGWMKHLAPYWTTVRINAGDLDRLREAQMMLQLQGIATDGGAANFPLLTAKMSAKELGTLKASFPRPGFVREIDALEGETKEFTAQLTGKAAVSASGAWKLIFAAKPEAVLETVFSSRSPVVQAKFKLFSTEWPQARQKIPYGLMQEMRIVPGLDGYDELVESLFFELMDGRLGTPEEMKAFLEPFSPPAPPPPVSLRRARAAKKDAKPARGRGKKGKAEELFAEAEDEMAEVPTNSREEDRAGRLDEPEDDEGSEEDEEESASEAADEHAGEDEAEVEQVAEPVVQQVTRTRAATTMEVPAEAAAPVVETRRGAKQVAFDAAPAPAAGAKAADGGDKSRKVADAAKTAARAPAKKVVAPVAAKGRTTETTRAKVGAKATAPVKIVSKAIPGNSKGSPQVPAKGAVKTIGTPSGELRTTVKTSAKKMGAKKAVEPKTNAKEAIAGSTGKGIAASITAAGGAARPDSVGSGPDIKKGAAKGGKRR